MDYSIHSYLERQPVDVLIMLLQQYAQNGLWEDYLPVVAEILNILTVQNIEIPQDIQRRLLEIQEAYRGTL